MNRNVRGTFAAIDEEVDFPAVLAKTSSSDQGTPPPPGTRRSPEEIKASFDDFGMTLLGDPLTKEEIMQTT
jgi:hypothetical protein